MPLEEVKVKLYWMVDGSVQTQRPVSVPPAGVTDSYRSVYKEGGERPTTVGDVMSSPVLALDVGGLVDDAINLLEENDLHHLPLTRSGLLVGLVSDRDLYRALDEPDKPVSQVMTRQLVVTTPDTPLRDAAGAMMERKISCLPVVDADTFPVGIVTIADVMSYLVTHPSLKLWD